MRVKLDRDPTLNAQAVFEHAVHLMAQLAHWNYEGNVYDGIHIQKPSLPEEIYVHNVPWAAHNRFQLKHAIQALYESCVALARRVNDRPGYLPIAFAGLYIQGDRRGVLGIRPKYVSLDSVAVNSTLNPTSEFSELDRTSRGPQGNTRNSSLTADHGELVDDNDPKFKITWKANQDTIDPTDLWTAILDALGTAAQHDGAEKAADVTGIGTFGRSEINVHAIQLPDRTRKDLNWYRLVRAIQLLWGAHIIWPHCGTGVDFVVSYDNVQVGVGSVDKREGFHSSQGSEISK